jgi:hypothetical protein
LASARTTANSHAHVTRFTATSSTPDEADEACSHSNTNHRRRRFLQTAFVAAAASLLPSSPSLGVIMDNTSDEAKVFTAGQAIGSKEAKARFLKAKADLKYLVDHYDDIVKSGGGDGVRRYLGTVGVTSNMYGISKVLKELQQDADDIVEFTENMNDFDSALLAADTACYSAIFVEYSAAKTKPEKFFADALQEVKRMQAAMEAMSAELQIK